tara:strand:- start:598 stop:819 length:222 start_codon:yes stop_codon:yes gene_type:complete
MGLAMAVLTVDQVDQEVVVGGLVLAAVERQAKVITAGLALRLVRFICMLALAGARVRLLWLQMVVHLHLGRVA